MRGAWPAEGHRSADGSGGGDAAADEGCGWLQRDAEVATYVADAAQEQLAEAAIAKVVSQFSDERGS